MIFLFNSNLKRVVISVIFTISLRVTDEINVHLLRVDSNEDIGTNFAIELSDNLNKLRVEQGCSLLQLS